MAVHQEGSSLRRCGARRRARGAGVFCALLAAWLSPLAQSLGGTGGTETAGGVGGLTPAIVTSDVRADTGDRIVINLQVGADRFYENGYYGFWTAIANIEAGHIWNGHEILSNVDTFINDPSIEGETRQYDYHATMVGGMLAGLGPFVPGVGYYYYQFGMAPGATLWSGAIASQWVGDEGEFETTEQAFDYAYVTAMQTGALRPLIPGTGIYVTRPADVINSSWGFEDSTGGVRETMVVDALAAANHQTVVIAAGNHESGEPMVTGPASGFNKIAVAALESDVSGPPYGYRAVFSNAGPNDFYNPQTGLIIPAVRPSVDIAAPGTDMVLPAYLGATGTNHSGTVFDTSEFDPSDLDNLYFFGAAGTSFASPVVAGGAALVVDAGYANFGTAQAVDGRVVKAVLLNAADKIAGWTNHTQIINGVLRTEQGLDYATGAGALNLNRAYDQYLAGTTDLPGLKGGAVQQIGWDFARVTPGQPNDYYLLGEIGAGGQMTVTLDWFVERTYDEATGVAADLRFDVLDLEIWKVEEGEFTTLIAISETLYNNVQHLYFAIPEEGYYGIRVRFAGQQYDFSPETYTGTDYALAWYVPEPGTLGLLSAVVIVLIRRRR